MILRSPPTQQLIVEVPRQKEISYYTLHFTVCLHLRYHNGIEAAVLHGIRIVFKYRSARDSCMIAFNFSAPHPTRNWKILVNMLWSERSEYLEAKLEVNLIGISIFLNIWSLKIATNVLDGSPPDVANPLHTFVHCRCICAAKKGKQVKWFYSAFYYDWRTSVCFLPPRESGVKMTPWTDGNQQAIFHGEKAH